MSAIKTTPQLKIKVLEQNLKRAQEQADELTTKIGRERRKARTEIKSLQGQLAAAEDHEHDLQQRVTELTAEVGRLKTLLDAGVTPRGEDAVLPPAPETQG